MFIGHYGVSYLLKKKYEKIPLWVLFIAVQFVDILSFLLVLFGAEHVSYKASENPFLRASIDYIPFSHSLSSGLLIAFFTYVIFCKLKNKYWGIALSLAVVSHWPMDFIAHLPDMPILFNSYKVGLGLWKHQWYAFFLEITFFVTCGYFYYRKSRSLKRPIFLILFLVASFTPLMFSPDQEVSTTVFSIISLSCYSLFAILAYWTEKNDG